MQNINTDRSMQHVLSQGCMIINIEILVYVEKGGVVVIEKAHRNGEGGKGKILIFSTSTPKDVQRIWILISVQPYLYHCIVENSLKCLNPNQCIGLQKTIESTSYLICHIELFPL